MEQPTQEHFRISIDETPSYLVLSISDSAPPSLPWRMGMAWSEIQSRPTRDIVEEIYSSWVASRPNESATVDAARFISFIISHLEKQGTTFSGVRSAPPIPQGAELKEEDLFFVGPDGAFDLHHGNFYHVRYVVFNTGNVVILPDYAPWRQPDIIRKVQFKDFFRTRASFDTELFDLRNKVRQTTQACYNPHCSTSQNAIRSHVLQENGMLNYAAEYIHNAYKTVELKLNNFYLRYKKGLTYTFTPYPITSNGTYEFTFWGFCEKCDHDIFKSLEDGSQNYSDVNFQLLIAYRGLLNELNKKEYNLKYHLAVENENYPLGIKHEYRNFRIEHIPAILALYGWKHRIEQSIFDSAIPSPFKYIYFAIPKIAIAASCLLSGRHYGFAMPDEQELFAFKPDYKQPLFFQPNEQLDEVRLMHLIPSSSELHVCFAYTGSATQFCSISVNDISALSVDEKIKLIGDVIITQGETWGIAPSIYNSWKKSGKEIEILKSIQYHRPIEKKDEAVAIDLL